MAAYNKSFIQITLIKLLDFYITKWRDGDRGNYTRFFNIARSLFQPKENQELNFKLSELRIKYKMSLSQLENIIYQMKFLPQKRAIMEIKILDGLGEGWHRKLKIEINHYQAEQDLNYIVRWVLIKLHELASRNNIDFTSMPEYQELYRGIKGKMVDSNEDRLF